MTNISEQSQWENEVSMLSRADRVEGGRTGAANVQAKQLANRTRYLKQTLEAYSTLIKSGELPFSTEDDARAAIAAGKIPEGALFSIRSQNNGVWVDEYKNENGVPVATGKRIPDSEFVSVVVFPSADDPTGTVAGLAITVPGQTFRVNDDKKEVVYRNNAGTALKVLEVTDRALLDNLLPGAGINTAGDPAYTVEFVDKLLRRAVGIDNQGVLEANAGMKIMGVPVNDLPEDSEYCLVFGDGKDRVAFGIGKTGFIEILGMRVYVTEGDNLVEVIDAYHRVAGGINSDGVIFSNSQSTDGGTVNDEFIDFCERLHLIIYGQSLSNGQYGVPVLNTPVTDALMFNTGVRSNGYTPTSLVPLKEIANAGNGETIASALVHGFVSRSGGMYDRNLICNAGGVGGITIEGLMKGTGNYTQLLAHLNWTAGQMKNEGREYSPDFIFWLQGEANMANGTSADSYKNSLSQLYTDLNADTAGIRASGLDMVLFSYQTSSHGFYVGTASNPPEMIAQAQLELALSHPNIDMWGPTYMGLPANHNVNQGNVHHNNHGYRLQGLYAQKALRHRLKTRSENNPNGQKYKPVHAEWARKINASTVIVSLFTYHPPFVIDSSYVTELPDGNHGVELHDNTGRLSITAVEVVGGTKLRITTNATIGDGAFVAFAWTPDNRGAITSNRYQSWFFGRETGVRTTIHDSDPETTDLLDENGDPYPLYNYLPIQKIYLTE